MRMSSVSPKPVVVTMPARPILPSMSAFVMRVVACTIGAVMSAGRTAAFASSWRTPVLFRWLGEAGSVPEMDLRRSFNMGIGMILVVAAADVEATRAALLEAGEANAVAIGAIEAGTGGVHYA